MSDNHPTVIDALRAVSADVEAITKDRTANAGGTYKYRGIEDVLSALHDPFIKHGVLVVPRVMHADTVLREIARTDKQGNTIAPRMEYEARLLVSYTFYGPAGDSVEAVVYTTGCDSGDKCTGKALSYGYKNAMFQVLCIPTAAAEDNEASGPEPVRQERATVAIHPQFPALRDRLKALKVSDPDRYSDCIFHFEKQGLFTRKADGGSVPNHPFDADQMNAMLDTVNRAEEGMVPWMGDIPVLVVADPSKPDPQSTGDVDPTDLLGALSASMKPKHSLTAISVMEEALDTAELPEGDITPTMWALAESDPAGIDWKQQAKIFNIKVPDMLAIAKQAHSDGDYDIDPPRTLADIDNPKLADDMRLLVLRRIAKEVPFG